VEVRGGHSALSLRLRLTASIRGHPQVLVVLGLCTAVALPAVLATLFIVAALQLGRRRRRHKHGAQQSGRPPRHPQVRSAPATPLKPKT
jgi:hypothetical protein